MSDSDFHFTANIGRKRQRPTASYDCEHSSIVDSKECSSSSTPLFTISKDINKVTSFIDGFLMIMMMMVLAIDIMISTENQSEVEEHATLSSTATTTRIDWGSTDEEFISSNYTSSLSLGSVRRPEPCHHDMFNKHHAVAMIMSFLLPTIGIELGIFVVTKIVTMPAIASFGSGLLFGLGARSSSNKLSGLLFKFCRKFIRRRGGSSTAGTGAAISSFAKNTKTISQGFQTLRRKLFISCRAVASPSTARKATTPTTSRRITNIGRRRRTSSLNDNVVLFDYTYKDAPFSNTTSEVLGL